jgi:hypothetical protein
VVVNACHPATAGSLNRRIVVQASLGGKKQEPLSKITIAKRAKGVLHVVEHLHSKHQA